MAMTKPAPRWYHYLYLLIPIMGVIPFVESVDKYNRKRANKWAEENEQ